MPDLYRLHVGPVNTAYYQRHFQRFESAGKATPSWNNGAAFFTLAWLLLRKLWRPAGIYGALLLVVLALWWWGLHGHVSLAVEGAVCAVAALLMCVVPGFIGNGLYYHHVRKLTLQTLTSATSLGQARAQLAEQAVTKERLQLVASIQAVTALAMALALFFQPSENSAELAPPDAAVAPTSGPPDLVIPSITSVEPLQVPPFTPDVALPMPESSLPAATAPMQEAIASTVTAVTPEAAPAAQELSMVTLAQSIPAQATATAIAVAATAPAAAQVPPAQAAVEPSKPATTAAPAPAEKPAAPPKPAAPVATKSKPPSAAKSAPAPASGKAEGKYYLNAGVYAQASNVDATVKKLKAAKLSTIRQTVSGKNGELTRLRIGPFETRKQAEQAAAQARKLRIETSIIESPKR